MSNRCGDVALGDEDAVSSGSGATIPSMGGTLVGSPEGFVEDVNWWRRQW